MNDNTTNTMPAARMRYELERTWSLPHRLRAWQSREPVRGRTSPSVQQRGHAIFYEEYQRLKQKSKV